MKWIKDALTVLRSKVMFIRVCIILIIAGVFASLILVDWHCGKDGINTHGNIKLDKKQEAPK